MTRIRIPVRDLAPGDLVPQTFWTSEEGRRQESGRTVVIGKVISARLTYAGSAHAVTRITGHDPETSREVMWVAVSSEPVVVLR